MPAPNPHSRLRRLAATLVLAGAALAASFALLEIGVRLAVGEQPKFPRRVVGAPFGLRINEPGARYRHDSADVTVEFRINGQGLRADRDYPYAKPPGVRRIVSLGDSYTVGYEVELEETFSQVLERELVARGYAVEVLNAGVSGYSTAEELLYLERELLRYEPDLVLVSFYGNDLVDNSRTGLFRLEDGALVEAAHDYVPGGGTADFLNTNPVFNFLSERSDAFVLGKEVATQLAKRRMVEENVSNLDQAVDAPPAGAGPGPVVAAQRRFAAALFERLYQETRERGIPLVIQSIPTAVYRGDEMRLVELFPLAEFDVRRPGLHFLATKPLLDPEVGRTLLYYTRSHGHWTPASHRLAGEALARIVAERGLLGAPGSAHQELDGPLYSMSPVARLRSP
jgi:lysophospholipase L1-like esterase